MKTESKVNFFFTFSISEENQQECVNEIKLYLHRPFIFFCAQIVHYINSFLRLDTQKRKRHKNYVFIENGRKNKL